MRRFLASFFRITTRSAFLAIALLLGLVLWHLPNLLNLDAFRPALVEFLETTFHCDVLVGDITGHLVPTPGLSVGHVVFLETEKPLRVLASVNSVHLWLAPAALLKGRLQITSLRFLRPRFIIHLTASAAGEKHWSLLGLPRAVPTKEGRIIEEWQIRNGSIEFWDHTTTPTTKWVADQFTGSFQVNRRTGALVGKAAKLGRNALLDIHIDENSASPLHGRCTDVELGILQPLIHTNIVTLQGHADIAFSARFLPKVAIHAELSQPHAAGEVTIVAETGAHKTWTWSAQGRDSHVEGTAFHLPEWSAKSDEQGVAVYVRAGTSLGGAAEITWTRLAGEGDPALDVDASSVTIRQVLEIFHLESKPNSRTPGTLNPFGFEPWLIHDGSMRAVVHEGTALEVLESDVNVAGMHLDLSGTFGLQPTNRQAQIQGSLQGIPVEPIVESFFGPPSPVTGTGRSDFALAFPLSRRWIQGLNGTLAVEIDQGVVRALKTMYRIMSVLNLSNYFRLRLPQVSAKGIVFDALTGHIAFQNGVLSSDDLFLKSPDMNVGAKGAVDIPAKRIKTTLRLEMFRFLEDILKYVPITHWIFKKPNKIFLPLVVTVEGPWDNLDIH